MLFKRTELPSFMRMKYLKQMETDGKLHYVFHDNQVAGFYVVDGSHFKCLYIASAFRKQGLATKVIQTEMAKQVITIATTRRICGIKRIIQRLGFTQTDIVVQGKQSLLEIWKSPDGLVC
jgi:GNAT superfamily N-acetyltransferase